jgi:hypothetical protein
MLVVRLLAPSTMTNNRILFTNRHRRKMILSHPSAQQTAICPRGADTGQRGSLPLTRPASRFESAKMLGRKRAPPLKKFQLKENMASYCQP